MRYSGDLSSLLAGGTSFKSCCHTGTPCLQHHGRAHSIFAPCAEHRSCLAFCMQFAGPVKKGNWGLWAPYLRLLPCTAPLLGYGGGLMWTPHQHLHHQVCGTLQQWAHLGLLGGLL